MSDGTRKSPRGHLVSAVGDESDEVITPKDKKPRKTLAVVEPTRKESKAYVELIHFSVAIPRTASLVLTFDAMLQRYASSIVGSESLEIESGASTNATFPQN